MSEGDSRQKEQYESCKTTDYQNYLWGCLCGRQKDHRAVANGQDQRCGETNGSPEPQRSPNNGDGCQDKQGAISLSGGIEDRKNYDDVHQLGQSRYERCVLLGHQKQQAD